MSEVYSLNHAPPPPHSLWRHLKRGIVAEVKCLAAGQGAGIEGVALVVYSDGGQIWARPAAEFLDGRFVRVDK